MQETAKCKKHYWLQLRCKSQTSDRKIVKQGLFTNNITICCREKTFSFGQFPPCICLQQKGHFHRIPVWLQSEASSGTHLLRPPAEAGSPGARCGVPALILYLYARCSSSFMLSVALCWTQLPVAPCLSQWGAQNWTRLSRAGLTSAEDKGKHHFPQPAGNAPKQPRISLAFAIGHVWAHTQLVFNKLNFLYFNKLDLLKTAFQPGSLQHVLLPGIVPPQAAPSSPLLYTSCIWKYCKIIKLYKEEESLFV